MLPRDQLSLAQVARLAATTPVYPVGDARQQAFQRALAGQLGRTLQAEVLSRLDDGSFVVRLPGLGDQAARLPLPAATQIGARLPLTLVALQPRPTFQVGQDAPVFAEAGPAPAPGAAAGSDPAPLAYLEGKPAAALARNAALLASARGMSALPYGGADGAGATISPRGRAIGAVLAAAQSSSTPATAALGQAPLLGAPTADAGRIGAALRDGLEHSGLFYEAHVAEWAEGTRTLAQLALEPQARGAMPSALDPQTAQFINLQLAAQEQGRVAWQGQLWPGQDLRWEIERRPQQGDSGAAPDQDQDDEGGAHWESRLRLSFGSLGEVKARIVLDGERLHVRLDAAPDAGARMDAARARLASALDAAGTPLATLAIHAALPPSPPDAGSDERS